MTHSQDDCADNLSACDWEEYEAAEEQRQRDTMGYFGWSTLISLVHLNHIAFSSQAASWGSHVRIWGMVAELLCLGVWARKAPRSYRAWRTAALHCILSLHVVSWLGMYGAWTVYGAGRLPRGTPRAAQGWPMWLVEQLLFTQVHGAAVMYGTWWLPAWQQAPYVALRSALYLLSIQPHVCAATIVPDSPLLAPAVQALDWSVDRALRVGAGIFRPGGPLERGAGVRACDADGGREGRGGSARAQAARAVRSIICGAPLGNLNSTFMLPDKMENPNLLAPAPHHALGSLARAANLPPLAQLHLSPEQACRAWLAWLECCVFCAILAFLFCTDAARKGRVRRRSLPGWDPDSACGHQLPWWPWISGAPVAAGILWRVCLSAAAEL